LLQAHVATVAELFAATNAFDADRVVRLFAADAIIDDPSTGEVFKGHAGVRDYVERFFVGYRTFSRPLSQESDADGKLFVRVDFTGDFGHEMGRMEIVFALDGLISRIDADLE